MPDAAHTAAPLRSRYADDPEMVEIVHLFVARLPERISSLRAALDDGDAARLCRLAHQLAGAAGGYGFPDLSSAAAALERALGDGAAGAARCRAEFDAVIDVCHRVAPC